MLIPERSATYGKEYKYMSIMTIKADFKRILSSWQFYVSIIGGLILFLHPVLFSSYAWSNSSPLELFSIAMGISDFTPFAVIFAVLPYAASFSVDYRTKHANSIVARIGFRKYICSRWASVSLSGALVMGIMMSVTVVFCQIASGSPETLESASFLNVGPWAVGNLPLAMHGLWFYILRILLAMLFGSLWATVGLIVAAIIPNPYAALVLPFIIYQVLWYLLELSIFNPLYYFRADYNGIPSLQFAFFYQIFWNIMVGLGSIFLMKRRLLE